MSIRSAGIISAVGLALALGPATASAGGDTYYQGSKAQQSQQKQKTVSGEIAATKLVDVTRQGRTESHVVALVRKGPNEFVTVDLGPHDDLRVAVPVGAEIEARGQMAQIGDRSGLLAQRATIEGRQVQIQQPMTAQQQQQRFQQQPQWYQEQPQQRQTLRGEVLRKKRVQISGENITHQVVLLETDRGERHIVDLGPERNLRQVRIQPGQQLTVRGEQATVGQQRVVKADRLRADGRTIRIQRASI